MENYTKLLEITKDGSEKYFDEQMELLKQLCSVDCPTGYEPGNAQVVAFLKTAMEKLDMTIEEHYDAGTGIHLVGRIKPENPDGKIIISAHLDTFNGFALGDVEKNPFRIEGDWAYGVGIADCKGGVVSSLYSIRMLQEAGMLPNKEIVLMYTSDEEIGSLSARKLFIPESEGAEMCFVFEPARNDNSIITARNGISISQINVKGVATHAGTAYKAGRSAARELCKQAVRLFEYTDFDNITYDVSMMYSNKGMSDEAHARVSASMYSEKGMEMLQEHLKDITDGAPFVDGCTCSVDMGVLHPRMNRSEKTVEMYNHIHKMGLLMGFDYPEEPPTGASDGNLFSSYGVPSIDGLGPYMKEIHTLHERMYVPSMPERTQLFALVVGSL